MKKLASLLTINGLVPTYGFLYTTSFLPEVESRTQGSRPKPRLRTQKKSEAKAKDSLSEDRPSRGQVQVQVRFIICRLDAIKDTL